MSLLTITVFVVLSIGLFWAGVQLYRLHSMLCEQQHLLKNLTSELNAIANGSIGLGNSLLRTEKQLKDLKSRHQDLVSFGNDDHYQKRTYKQANQLALMGATIDELKQSCELSHGEAELLAHMSHSSH